MSRFLINPRSAAAAKVEEEEEVNPADVSIVGEVALAIELREN